MLRWWLDGEATRFVSHGNLDSIYRTHFKDSDLVRLPPTAITAGRIEAFLLAKETKYAATYVKLRSAMARAGIVRGYKRICRRCKPRRVEEAQDGAIRRCPKCNAKMWLAAVPKPCTFYELRHTTATLLLAAGADLWAVQKMLRYTDAQVTTERYAHLVPGYLQEQIGRLKLTGFASPLLPHAANDEGRSEAPAQNNQGSQGIRLERETGFEPATLSSGRARAGEQRARARECSYSAASSVTATGTAASAAAWASCDLAVFSRPLRSILCCSQRSWSAAEYFVLHWS
jgi:Phage integrase family